LGDSGGQDGAAMYHIHRCGLVRVDYG